MLFSPKNNENTELTPPKKGLNTEGRMFSEEFVNVNWQTKHQVDAIRHGTIEVVVFGFVVQEVICREGESDGSAEALDGRELPQCVGRVADGAGAFRDVVVVDELDVFHQRAVA